MGTDTLAEEVYAPREREDNVQLIKDMLAASDETSFDAARATAIEQFHPSLLAELDHLEHLPPANRQAWAAACADDLFEATLEANVDRRAGWSAVADDATRAGRIAAAVASLEDWKCAGIATSQDLGNELLALIDAPPSRPRAKEFERAAFAKTGRTWPSPPAPLLEPEGLDALRRWLEEQDRDARAAGLPELGDALGHWCEALTPALLERSTWAGDRSVGSGPCGRCAMVFYSKGYLSIDPTCPWFEQFGEGTIYIPTDFNLATCSFCGHEARINAPLMFYSRARNQVIYNLPAPGATPEQAQEFFRDLIGDVRAQYAARLDTDAAAAFDGALELVTYDLESFFRAVHYGETAHEEHVYLVLDLAGGESLIVDSTKQFFRGITRRERAQHARYEPASS